MKLIIGNKAYSSWSLRGWLACKQSGLPFEELTVPLYGQEWAAQAERGSFAPSGGKVPILWDGETVIWDSLAILDWLADKVGRDRFWPKDDTARGMARAMVAEMHSSFPALRRKCPMNTRRQFTGLTLPDDVQQDALRVVTLWAEARARFGKSGPFLFGTFGAADIFYAPVVTRFITYGFELPRFAQTYMQAVVEHDWMQQWLTAAEQEPWEIDKFEAAEVTEPA